MARLPSKPITEHLAYLLAQANREINRQLDARFRTEGVPVEQWRILKVLSDGEGHSMGELAEAVLLNCTLSGIAPEGWGPADQGGNVHFWEFRSRNADGTSADVHQRVSWSRQLDAAKDADFIRNYSNPAFVLGGWIPVVDQ